MTSPPRFEQLRTAALPAASALAKGPTGLALLAAKQGYGAVRRGRSARKTRAPAPRPRRGSGPLPGNRVMAIAALTIVAVGAIGYLARRRTEQPPIADAPPSLTDYGPTDIVRTTSE